MAINLFFTWIIAWKRCKSFGNIREKSQKCCRNFVSTSQFQNALFKDAHNNWNHLRIERRYRGCAGPCHPKFLCFHVSFGENWPYNRLAPPSGKCWITANKDQRWCFRKTPLFTVSGSPIA